MTEHEQQRMMRWRLQTLRHAQETTGNVAQTDNGAEFQSHFDWHLRDQGITHVYIRPACPRLNGKVERSHRVDDEEFYQLLGDEPPQNLTDYNAKLREWENYYNYHRPHGALNGQTPYERLREKMELAV